MIRNKEYQIDTNINSYQMFFYPDVPPDAIEGVVGDVTNADDSSIFIRIVIDDEYMDDIFHQEHAFFAPRTPYCSECRIYLKRKAYDSIMNDHRLDAILWHEMGHFHTLQYFENKSREQMRAERMVADILPEEKAADLFALHYSQPDDMKCAFTYLIREANKRVAYDSNAVLTIRELRNRKSFISNVTVGEELSLLETIIA